MPNMPLWSELEAKIDLAQLPAFHRAFLKLHRPELESDTLPLRRVQQYVSQTLHALAKSGKAIQTEDDFRVSPETLPDGYKNLAT